MGGGSLANVPQLAEGLPKSIVEMLPDDRLEAPEGLWCLADRDPAFLICGRREGATTIRLPSERYEWAHLDLQKGHVVGGFSSVTDGKSGSNPPRSQFGCENYLNSS